MIDRATRTALADIQRTIPTTAVDTLTTDVSTLNTEVATINTQLLPNPLQFGAVADGSTDDSTALSSLFTYCYNNNLNACSLLGLYYGMSNSVNIPDFGGSHDFVIFGQGARIAKRANMTYMFDVPQYTKIYDLFIRGNGGTYTGGCYQITSGNYQEWINCKTEDFDTTCLDNTTASTGQNSTIQGGHWWSHTSDSSHPAIKWPNEGFVSSHRRIISVNTDGGWLVDVNGCDNGTVMDCSMHNMLWGTSAKKVRCIGNRMANSENMIVSGSQHTIVGNIFANNIEFDANASQVVFGSNLVSGDITCDASSNNIITYGNYLTGTYTNNGGASNKNAP